MKPIWIALPLLLLLSACGGGSTQSATSVADDLKVEISAITESVEITEENDPNDLIGRPGGYTESVVLHDSRVACDDDVSVGCGAKVEVFDDSDAAADRADYIQSILEGNAALGTEYHYVDGPVLLRVSGELKPSAAEEYEAAFAS